MSEIKSYAVTVGELRKLGSCGYPDDTMMVPYNLAIHVLQLCEEANKLLIKENDKWAKELEIARNEIDRLRH